MTDPTSQMWTQMGQTFQDSLAKGWGQAMQHFQTMDIGGVPSAPASPMPALKFNADKLQ